MRLAFLLSLLICQKDTARFDEASSPNDVIDMMIVYEKQKSPADGVKNTCRGRIWFLGSRLEQIEFLGPADSRPAIIDPQFGENVTGVGAKGVGRDDQLASNFGAA